MTASDWIIIQGIISLAITLIGFIIAALLIEWKLDRYDQKWAFYGIVFLVGLLIAIIFPMSTNGGGRIELRTISLVGILLCALAVFAFLTSHSIFYEKNIGKRMVDNARKYAAELGLNVNGIPNDKKYDFKKLYFTYRGLLDNRWGILLYDERKIIRSNSIGEKSSYQNLYHYEIRLSKNKACVIRIFEKKEPYNYVASPNETLLKTNDTEIDKAFTIFCSGGENSFLNLIKKEAFKNFLLKNKSLFEYGLKVNTEPEIVHLCVRSLHPNFGIFKDNYKIEFEYHLQKKKEHIQFLKEFILFFDEA
jgi:hypothetical protein